jgi:hypothetical protein
VLLRQQGQGVAGAGVARVCWAGAIEGVGIAPGGAPAEEKRSQGQVQARGKREGQGLGMQRFRHCLIISPLAPLTATQSALFLPASLELLWQDQLLLPIQLAHPATRLSSQPPA